MIAETANPRHQSEPLVPCGDGSFDVKNRKIKPDLQRFPAHYRTDSNSPHQTVSVEGNISKESLCYLNPCHDPPMSGLDVLP